MQEISSLKGSKGLALKRPSIDYRPFLAFFATLVFYLFLSVICQKYPFGIYSTSISDLTAQYAPFLAMYRNRMGADAGSASFLSHLMYSFDQGLGGNYMSMFGYYLASPFNLLFAFFDASFIDGFVLILMILKMSFASAFMCMFMSLHAKDKKCLWPALFGIMYSFTSYSTAFLCSIMWLDGYMLLSLVLFFTEKFIRDDRKLGLILTLPVLFLSNYYIAYMAGVFTFIYLLVRMGSLGEFKDMKKAVKKVVRFVIVAALDAMIMCVILVPVALATLRNADPTVSKPNEHFIMYNAKDMLDHFFEGIDGEFGDVMPANLPFLFCGLLITILMVMFFVSKAFDRKDKIRYLLCLAGVYLSTAIYWIDVAWQAFDSPNWFWHRHSFVFIPLFFIIAAKAYEGLSKVTRREFFISLGIVLGWLFAAQSFGNMKSDKIFIANLALVISIFVLLFFMNKNDWSPAFADMPKIMPLLLAIVVCFESVYIQPLLATDVSALTLYNGSAEQYRDSIMAMKDLKEVGYLTAQKNRAFRAEDELINSYVKTNYVIEHPNMFGGFHGMTFFNSSSNKSLHRFIKQLGYPVNYNYFAESYTYCASDSDAFFSIGAMTTMRDYTNAVFVNDDQYDIGYKFYANKYVLPLAFAADKKALDFDFYALEKTAKNKDYFAFRNQWYRSLFPDYFTEDYFITVPSRDVEGPVVTNGTTVNSNLMTMVAYKAKNDPSSASSSDDANETRDQESFDRDRLGLEDLAASEAAKNAVTYYRNNENIPVYIEYRMPAPVTGEIYFNLTAPATTGEMSVYVNDIFMSHASSGTYFSQVFRLGTFKKGDEIKVTITSEDDKFTYLDARFGYFDYEVFGRQFSMIDRDEVIVNEAVDGYVNLTSNIRDGEMVITTVPYEEGWTLKIDGQEAQIVPYQGAFVAFEVPAGSHTCELSFIAPGFKGGAVISAAGLIGMVVFALIDRKKKTVV